MMESIIIALAIDAKKTGMWQLKIYQGPFFHAANNKKDVMFMKGKMAELMVHVTPQIWRKYITTAKQGEKIMYMKCKKLYMEC